MREEQNDHHFVHDFTMYIFLIEIMIFIIRLQVK